MPLKERLRAKSPRSSLSPFFQMLIVIHVGYHIASCMKGNFTNTLLFRETESQNTIMLYNIFLFFAECVGMTVAAPLARRRGCVFCMRLGLAVHMFMQAAFFILLERITAVMPLMALLNGLSVGYYWMAYYTDVSEFSQDENRDRAIGVMGVYTSAVTLIMPAVCGAVISAMPGYAGYRLMFAVCAAVSFAALLFSSRLAGHPIPAQPESRRLEALRLAARERVWRFEFTGEFLRGIRDGTMAFFLNILLFAIIRSESLVGFNTLLTGVAAIAGHAAARRVRPQGRTRCMCAAVTVLLVCALALFWRLTPGVLIFVSAANAFFAVFLLNPSLGIFFMLLEKTPDGERLRPEFIMLRSYSLCGGRIIGALITLLFPVSAAGSVAAICVLTLSQYLTVLVYRRTTALCAQE